MTVQQEMGYEVLEDREAIERFEARVLSDVKAVETAVDPLLRHLGFRLEHELIDNPLRPIPDARERAYVRGLSLRAVSLSSDGLVAIDELLLAQDGLPLVDARDIASFYATFLESLTEALRAGRLRANR